MGTVLTCQQQLVARAMSEAELQDTIIQLAEHRGWTVFHARDSRRQRLVGLPDLELVRPPRRMRWEIKTQQGKVTPIQQVTMDLLVACGENVSIVRPQDWLDGTVERRLR